MIAYGCKFGGYEWICQWQQRMDCDLSWISATLIDDDKNFGIQDKRTTTEV